jgi:hypothetical protein
MARKFLDGGPEAPAPPPEFHSDLVQVHARPTAEIRQLWCGGGQIEG